VSRRTETSYKAESLGKAAQHVKAPGSGDTVNGAVVQRKFMFLSGEACPLGGVNRCPVKLPEGATGNQRSRLFQDRALAWERVTNQRRADRAENCSAPCRAICMVRGQESAEAIVA
jgi:hypothetical protein